MKSTEPRRSLPLSRPDWLLTLLVSLLVALLVACGQPEPTPGAVTRAGAAAAPKRAAGRLLFVRGGQVWLWADGQETQLTTDGGNTQPRWSPDGSAFVYIHNGDSFADLWLATNLGQSLRQMTYNQATDAAPNTKAYVANSWLVTGPTWARLGDGTDRIVYSSDRGQETMALWVINGLRGTPQRVESTAVLPGHVEGASLSPNGRFLAFTFDTSDPQLTVRTTHIYVVDLESGVYQAVASEPTGAYDPAWSPDGQWIAYVSRKEGGTNLWVMRADGSNKHRLTDGGTDRGPAWSPDGDQIAFTRQAGGGFGLYYVDLTVTPSGSLATSGAQPVGNYTDVDPSSGVSWAR